MATVAEMHFRWWATLGFRQWVGQQRIQQQLLKYGVCRAPSHASASLRSFTRRCLQSPMSKLPVATRQPSPARATKSTRIRIGMLLLILMATTVNYVDRSNLSIVAAPLSRELKLNPVQMGHLLSAFAWSYALATLAGGFLVDRLGTRLVYGLAQLLWSAATFALAFTVGFASLFGLRLLVGLTESPVFPANNRVVALWFPQRERGRATGTYIMGQYIGTALLTPLLAWMAMRSAGGRSS